MACALRPPRRGTIRLADGLVNYLFLPPPPNPRGPPVLLMGGLAQTIDTFAEHHVPIAQSRSVSVFARQRTGCVHVHVTSSSGRQRSFLCATAVQEVIVTIPLLCRSPACVRACVVCTCVSNSTRVCLAPRTRAHAIVWLRMLMLQCTCARAGRFCTTSCVGKDAPHSRSRTAVWPGTSWISAM